MAKKLYWIDDHRLEAEARVTAINEAAIAVDQTCFYPGGGGQPHDTGRIRGEDGKELEVVSVHTASDEEIWHLLSEPPGEIAGQKVTLMVDQDRRNALARYHTVLHVLNTIMLRDHEAMMTGVQIAADYARIDFKIEQFSAALNAALEEKVNSTIRGNHSLKSYWMPEEEFERRTDLRRTLEVKPPVHQGYVRIVEIEGFDAQACGGTHTHTTGEVGNFSIYKTENKGKINKRLYVRLG